MKNDPLSDLLLFQNYHVKKFLNIMNISTLFLFFCMSTSFAANTNKVEEKSLPATVTTITQQDRTIKGIITDSSGEPIIGANILVRGTINGTVTDINGNYTLSGVPVNAILVVSYIGFQTKEVTVGSQSTLNISLTEDSQALEEIVVVGYGTQRKSDVTGSISVATADDILKTSSFNALAGLKGKASGVNIFTNSGQPGGPTRVVIRGIGTINSSSNPLYVVDGVVMEDFQFLNPNDIERVEVLKDASAAAIYGARGANGVILVTSKRGLSGDATKSKISYDGYMSVSTPASKMETMNSAQFMEAMKVSFENDQKWYGGTQTFSVNDPRLFDASGKPLYDTDWQAETTRTAISHNHQLSIQQGGSNSSSGAFLNYTDQEGVMLNTYMKRLNGRLTYDAQPTKWLSTAINLLVNHTWQNDTDEGGGSQVARRTMIEMPPIFPVKWPDGTWSNSQSTDDFSFEAMANPVHLLSTQQRLRLRTQIFGNAALIFHLLPGLNFRTQFGVDAHWRKWKEYNPTDLINISFPTGYAYMSDTQVLLWQQENFLNYTNIFGKHRINAVAGLTWQRRTVGSSSLTTRGFSDDFYGYNNLGVATIPDPPSSSYDEWSMNSYFLRASYTYYDRYLATVTARMDGSSKFGYNNKYAFFPAVGLGWILSNESFLADASYIDQLKLHTSYGVTGNSEIGTYRSLAMVGASTALIDAQRQSIFYPNRLANPDLKWEKTGQYDLGLNLSLFRNRLTVDLSYYYKLTTDLLLDRPVPHSTGYSSVTDNIGEVSNRGIDFLLNTVNIKTRDFQWTSTLNLNYNKNKIEKLGENNEDILPGPSWVSGSQTILRVGESVSSFWGYERLGVWTQEEEAAAKAAGARVGQAKRSVDKKILGKGIPDLTGSFINTFNYKNFDLTVDLQFVTGIEILQQYSHSAEDRFGYTSGLASILTEGYNGTNPNTMVQAVRNANLSGQSSELDSRWVCDGSYLRANVIQLGYAFDRKTLQTLNISDLRIYASLNNAFVIHSNNFRGLDPEGTSQGDNQWGQNMFFFQYPKPRIWTLGLNVTF
ncbi:TonB-dependent receptor SusC [termite gut metagenome]|uniref:TonB-dependent receptor SusC n=1 Tax=termite gut metagenome TaxID=433724 RepID=A0A5J4S5J3_9ZZZZ